MKSLNVAVFLLGAIVAFSVIGVAQTSGRTFSIEAMPGFTWKGPIGSSGDTPVVIAKVKKGDVLVVTANESDHGFQTINSSGKVDDSLVRRCGETKDEKPAAVLREVCSLYGRELQPQPTKEALRLEVLENLAKDLRFWCVVHLEGMQAKIGPGS